MQDILQISQKGTERMLSYVRQYVLEHPTELKQKRARQKLKTSATTKKINFEVKYSHETGYITIV